MIGRGGAHGATASRFPVLLAKAGKGSKVPQRYWRLGPNAARVSQYRSGRARAWMMTAIRTPERSA